MDARRTQLIAGRSPRGARHFLAGKVSAGSVACAVAAALVVGPGLYHGLRLSWRSRALARKQQRLEALYRALQAEQQRLKSDPVYVEGLIRSTFKVAKPDEIVVPISDESSRR